MLRDCKQSIIETCHNVTDLLKQLQSNWTSNLLVELAEATRYNDYNYWNYANRLIENTKQCIDYVTEYCNLSKQRYIIDQINNTIESIANNWFDNYHRKIVNTVSYILAKNYDFKREVSD
jgi:hypothetical protein